MRRLARTALVTGLSCTALLGSTIGVASASTPTGVTPPATSRPAPSAKDATRLITERIAPLATAGGVSIDGAGYGSSFVAAPGSHYLFYGLTDRGPNVDGPNGTKIEPLPSFTPAIGEFLVLGDRAILLRRIPLRAADGTAYNGRVNTQASTGETITDLSGTVLAPSPTGYDPEGLAVMRDGTFWVSDEYGPFITHFDRWGRQLERLSPYDGTLPAELKTREPNRGMEGLTVTPDGTTLVGIMQSGLNAPDGPKAKNVGAVRIVTVDLKTRATKEYAYLLHETGDVSTSVSEIAALSNTEFLVDERDGNPEPGANKKLFKVSLTGATDLGPNATLPGSTYDASKGGLLVGGSTLEGIVRKGPTTTAAAALSNKGIAPVSSTLFLDVAGLVSSIAPDGSFFGHDKVEGVAVLDGGRQVVISNDSDFGIGGVTGTTPPFQLVPKLQPNGKQDTGELLRVDMAKVPAQFRG